MTHEVDPNDPKYRNLADVEHRRVDREAHIERWNHASEMEEMLERSHLEKSDMGQDRRQ